MPEIKVIGPRPDTNIARIYSYMQQVDIYTIIVIAGLPDSKILEGKEKEIPFQMGFGRKEGIFSDLEGILEGILGGILEGIYFSCYDYQYIF